MIFLYDRFMPFKDLTYSDGRDTSSSNNAPTEPSKDLRIVFSLKGVPMLSEYICNDLLQRSKRLFSATIASSWVSIHSNE